MTVEDIRNWVNFQINKSQSGNTLSKDEYNLCLSWANAEMFKIKYGLPEQYAPGRPLPAQAWSVTQENIDALSPFLKARGGKNYPPLNLDMDGRVNIPSDYVHYSSIRYNNKPVEVVSNDVIGNRLNSSIVYPDEKYPICSFYEGYMQFYPVTLKFVQFDYLRFPDTPVWGATIVNDEYVYQPTLSTELEWGIQLHVDFSNLVLKYASINLRELQVYQVAKQRQDQGQ